MKLTQLIIKEYPIDACLAYLPKRREQWNVKNDWKPIQIQFIRKSGTENWKMSSELFQMDNYREMWSFFKWNVTEEEQFVLICGLKWNSLFQNLTKPGSTFLALAHIFAATNSCEKVLSQCHDPIGPTKKRVKRVKSKK